jgi:hypothetical protein
LSYSNNNTTSSENNEIDSGEDEEEDVQREDVIDPSTQTEGDKKKSKKKRKSVAEPAGPTDASVMSSVSLTTKAEFSKGFFDKAQWKGLRSLTLDKTVTQIVLLFEKPVIPLGVIPRTYTLPDKLMKGETLEWAPTVADLEVFFSIWFEWLSMHQKGLVAAARTLLIISASDTPHSTVIQDTRTGLKIHQMCVSSYFRSDAEAKERQTPQEGSFVSLFLNYKKDL